jgi:RNA polymerase sigma-70 factor (ECF subfamily)
VVLGQLTPGERAAFLLHDVFGVPFERVAETVGRTPAACRQLASRARRAIRESGPTPSDVPRADPELQGIVDSFIAACAGGDLGALARTLHPDVSGWATRGGERVGSDLSAERVAAGSLRFLGPRSGWTLAPLALDDGMAVVATRGGDPVALIRLLVVDGLIAAIHTVLLR